MSTKVAAPQTAAHAVLLDVHGRVLLVRPSYKRHHHLPGGYVEQGEMPSQAVAREILEELSIQPTLNSGPAVIAWAPRDAERLIFLYVGQLEPEEAAAVRVDGGEIIDHLWAPVADLDTWLHRRVADRVRRALLVAESGDGPLFLEQPDP
ncbi:NUDIX hydrolase [Spirillospora sp. NPDC052269]